MQRTRLSSILLLASMCFRALGQDAEPTATPTPTDRWVMQGFLSLGMSQSAFSDEWPGGDKGSWNWIFNSELRAERQMNPRFFWSNFLQLSYGQHSSQEVDDAGNTSWSSPDKTTDLILFESVGRFDLQLWVEPYVSVRFDSQFLDDTDPLGTFYLSPSKLSETGGIARVFHKEEKSELISRFGIGFRQTLAQRFLGGDPNNSEYNATYDGGFEFQTQALVPMWDEAVTYSGKFLVFWPVFYDQESALEEFDELVAASFPGQEPIADFWRSPDVNWQNTFTARITEYLDVNLYLQLIYDHFDQSTKVDNVEPLTQESVDAVLSGVREDPQYKQTLALALVYHLF